MEDRVGEDKKQRKFWGTIEGYIFLFGCALFGAGTIVALYLNIPHKWKGISSMILAGIFGGRGVSIPLGLEILPAPYNKYLVIFVAALQDLITVFLFFPLIVYFRDRIVKKSFFGGIMTSANEAVHRGGKWLRRFRIVGVAFFVWIPFTMTGPLVGSALGLLLGMRAWRVMVVVAIAAVSSVFSWTYFLDFMSRWAGKMKGIVPIISVGAILIFLLIFQLHKFFSRRKEI